VTALNKKIAETGELIKGRFRAHEPTVVQSTPGA
jgi:hypothetical protein